MREELVVLFDEWKLAHNMEDDNSCKETIPVGKDRETGEKKTLKLLICGILVIQDKKQVNILLNV